MLQTIKVISYISRKCLINRVRFLFKHSGKTPRLSGEKKALNTIIFNGVLTSVLPEFQTIHSK